MVADLVKVEGAEDLYTEHGKYCSSESLAQLYT